MTPAHLETTPWLALIYAISIYALLSLGARILLTYSAFNSKLTLNSDRYGSLDGLRGMLSIGVLIHHSFAAYGYFTTGLWAWSNSPILNQLGQTTVALFFMITGFLFTIKASQPKIKWSDLYKSRVTRLAPLYAIVVVVVFAVVLTKSGGELHVAPVELFKQFLQWLAFACFGRPDINAMPMTWTIIAGVNWSLKYEIFFYIFCVPAIHLIAKRLSNKSCLITSLILLALALLQINPSIPDGHAAVYAAHFLGGVVAAFGYNTPTIKEAISTPLFKMMSLAALFAAATITNSYNTPSVLITIIIFMSIVGGASIFGLLKTRMAVWLGDVSYGIYLLHGIMIWSILSKMNPSSLADFTILEYWFLMSIASLCTLVLASLSYAKLEQPLMARVSRK